jgi:ferredoxin
MSHVPGLGIVRGMSLTLRRFFEPKVTHRYPEDPAEIPGRFRGRLQLLYDEYGTLKCETCFQCAQACPIECIDMGGHDTKDRFAVHWGAPETYGERREESALRRSGRTVPDPASDHFHGIDPAALEAILEDFDHDPKRMLQILEAVQAAYGHVPVAALKRISQTTGAWYAMLYGTATYYDHLAVGGPAAPDASEPGSEFVAALEGALAGGTRDATGSGPSAAGRA